MLPEMSMERTTVTPSLRCVRGRWGSARPKRRRAAMSMTRILGRRWRQVAGLAPFKRPSELNARAAFFRLRSAMMRSQNTTGTAINPHSHTGWRKVMPIVSPQPPPHGEVEDEECGHQGQARIEEPAVVRKAEGEKADEAEDGELGFAFALRREEQACHKEDEAEPDHDGGRLDEEVRIHAWSLRLRIRKKARSGRSKGSSVRTVTRSRPRRRMLASRRSSCAARFFWNAAWNPLLDVSRRTCSP